MIDKVVLSQHVDALVESHGVAVIPDAIEKRIYVRILRLMFDILDKMSGKTMFKIMGHEFSFNIRPGPIIIEDD